jgi:arylsulfatase A-like enzyme
MTYLCLRAMRRSCLLLATLVLGCAESPPGDILLITIDTVRADHLDLYGYDRPTTPNLSRIFADGAIFERAYATTSYTSASTASILTGYLPQRHRVREFDQIFPKETAILSELLAPRYQTVAFISTRILSDDGTGMGDRFDYFDDAMQPEKDPPERDARATTDAVLSWLRKSDSLERPLFLWVHFKDPHAPYRPPAPYLNRFQFKEEDHPELKAPAASKRSAVTPEQLAYADRYDEEIAYVDAEIGRLIDGYAEIKELDHALLIVTADHGECLLERKRRFVHAFHVFEELVRVPLLVRGPGVMPGRRQGLVSGIDIAPTVLAFAGVEVPPSFSGLDLSGREFIPPDRIVFAESIFFFLTGAQWRTAIQGNSKWAVKLHKGEQRELFFDLSQDPLERAPKAWKGESDAAHQLLELVASDPDPAGIPRDPERGVLQANNPDLLRALGYVE